MYFGLLAGLAVFTTVFVVLSAILGSGVIAVVTGALLEGDASALQFKVFTLLFNFSDGELIGKGDADFQGTAYGTRWSVCLLSLPFILVSNTKCAIGSFLGNTLRNCCGHIALGFLHYRKRQSQQYSSLRHCWCRRGDDFYFVPIQSINEQKTL